jgi:hypothetical protein
MALLELFAKFRQTALDRYRGRPKCKGVKKITITLDVKSINSFRPYDKEKKKKYYLLFPAFFSPHIKFLFNKNFDALALF